MILLPELGLHFADGLVMMDVDEGRPLDFGAWIAPDETDAAKRDAALEDMLRLKSGWRPNSETLATSPILHNWKLEASAPGVARLWGNAVGHPLFPPGGPIHTSLVIALESRDLKWARTASRFYRLAEPFGPHTRRSVS